MQEPLSNQGENEFVTFGNTVVCSSLGHPLGNTLTVHKGRRCPEPMGRTGFVK